MDGGVAQRQGYVAVADGGVPQRHIVAHAAVEQDDLLVYIGDGLHEMAGRNVLDLAAVDADRPRPWLEQTADQPAEGGFPAARPAHQRDALAGADRQAEILDQRRLLGVVAEGHIVELDEPADHRRRVLGALVEAQRRPRVGLVVEDIVEAGDLSLDGLQLGAEAHQAVERSRETARQRLKRHQPADRKRAVENAQPADPQDRHRRKPRQQRRDDAQQPRQHAELLPRDEGLGVQPGPPGEKVALGAVRLQRLDHADAVHRRAGEDAFFLEQAAIAVLAGPRHHTQGRNVECRHDESDEREHRVVGQHDRRVDGHRQRVDRVGGELARDHLRYAVVRGDPVGDVAGETLAEKRHRQGDHVPEEARTRHQRELGLHAGDADLLQPGEHALRDRRHAEADQQRRHERIAAGDQDIVHEHLGKGGDRQPRNDEQQSRRDDEEKRRPRLAEAREQARQNVRTAAAAAEFRAGLERQADAGETLVELLERQFAPALSRVVDVHRPPGDAFENDEVVEIPEDDHREGEVEQVRRLAPVALRGKAVFPRRAQNVHRLAAVPRNAAAHAQFLERNPAPVIGEDHREARRAAFGRLHLQDRRHRPAAAAPPQVRTQDRPVLAAGAGRPRGRRRRHKPNASLMSGTARVMGARAPVLTSAVARVPASSVSLDAFGEVQAKPLAVDGSRINATRPA